MIEERGSSTFSSIVNSLSFWKVYCLPLTIFMGVGTSILCKNAPFKWMEKHCSSSKKVINAISKRVYHFVCHCELSLLFKGIMPTSHCCHEWGTSPLFKITPYKWKEDAV
jgi:hypothetical protein